MTSTEYKSSDVAEEVNDENITLTSNTAHETIAQLANRYYGEHYFIPLRIYAEGISVHVDTLHSGVEEGRCTSQSGRLCQRKRENHPIFKGPIKRASFSMQQAMCANEFKSFFLSNNNLPLLPN